MSSNRLMYDACTYESKVKTSTGPYQYAIYNGKFENSSKCTIERNVVGGNHVSLYSGNLVDLESDLRGQTRLASKCPTRKYTPKNLDMTSYHGLNHVQNCNKMI